MTARSFDRHVLSIGLTVLALAVFTPVDAGAQIGGFPSPLRLADAVRIATQNRAEIEAARARARAGEARPVIVSALADPMIAPSIDHLPFMLNGADVSFSIEQQIPLSGIRGHRRESALADLERLRAEASRTSLDVGLEAATAFLMLQERRDTAALLQEQLVYAKDLVAASDARYEGATGSQADVLRAEVEVARLESQIRTVAGEVRSAEAMFNASVGLAVDTPVPQLADTTFDRPLPSWGDINARISTRPELQAGRADIARAQADVRVMQDMFRPMATIRTGPAYTMTEGRGWMGMVGLSIPLWRDKLRAGVAEAQAMRQMSEADLRAMTRMVEGQAAASLHEAQAAGDQQRGLRSDVLPRARTAIDPALAAYSSGRLPLVSVIEAIQALWSVQMDVIEADVRVGVAWTRLGHAIGSYEVLEP